MSKQINAVAYLRRSTASDSQETSIPDQRSAVREYAAKHSYRIIREYIDDAISGDDTANRHDFHRMLADAQGKGDFTSILCWDQDRFGRFDSQEAGYWTFPLRQIGVSLVTVNDGPIDWNDFTGRVMYGLKQEGKNQYLKDLSRNVSRGKLEAAKNGSWLGSAPYAYRIEGQRKHKLLVLDDAAKVRVVQRIFREFVEDGRSMSNIADRLEADGFPSPGERGKPWRFDTVKTILENPVYVGDYVGGRFSYGKYHSIKAGEIVNGNGRCRRPESDWVVKRDHHEAVIDRPTFERAKKILAKGKTGRSPHTPETNPYLLAGLLRCGRCGSPLWGMTANKINRYYRCSVQQYHGDGSCQGSTVREDAILRYIADHLDTEFLSLDGETLSRKAHHKELTQDDLPKAFTKLKRLIAPPKDLMRERERAKKLAKALDERIVKTRTNLARNMAVLDDASIAATQDEIQRLQAEREQLEQELSRPLPTEADLNAETIQILRTLRWTSLAFRQSADPENADLRKRMAIMRVANQVCGLDDFAPALHMMLKAIAWIVVHTKIVGEGRAVRHKFDRGEMAFRGSSYSREIEPSPPD